MRNKVWSVRDAGFGGIQALDDGRGSTGGGEGRVAGGEGTELFESAMAGGEGRFVGDAFGGEGIDLDRVNAGGEGGPPSL